MKSFKKILALVLSLLMIASVVVIPAAAEDAPAAADDAATEEAKITKEISVLDLGNIDDITGFYYDFHSASVVTLEDDTKALKIDTSAMTSTFGDKFVEGADLVNPFGMKVAIPAGSAQYVTAVSIVLDKQSDQSFVYNFGVTDGSAYSKKGEANRTWSDSGELTITDSIASLKKNTDGWYWGWWGNPGDPWNADFSYVNFCFAAKATEQENPYLLIKDIKITMEATQAEFDNLPITKTFNVLDLADVELGDIDTLPGDLSSYWYDANGVSVIEYEGKKALKIDTSAMTGSGADKFVEGGGYENCFGMGAPIPVQYSKYVDSINLKMVKNNASAMIYNFGVANGSTYSKPGSLNNVTDATGVINFQRDPSQLFKNSDGWYWGWYGGSDEKWDGGFNEFYIAFGCTADESEDPHVIITDMYYTVSATTSEWEAIEQKIESEKMLITDFEGSGNSTDYAVSGEYSASYTCPGNWHGQGIVDLTKVDLTDATGISFWVYSDQTRDNLRMAFYGNEYPYFNPISTVAGEWTKVYIDFNHMTLKYDGDNWWGSTEDYTLTAEDKATLTEIVAYDWDQSGAVFYFDDFYIVKNAPARAEDKTIEFTENNVTLPEGAVLEDGKVIFAPGMGAADFSVKVPEGTVSDAYAVEYHYTTTANAAPPVQLYMRGEYNWAGGQAHHIKRGEIGDSGTLSAGTTSAHVLDFNKTNGGGAERVYSWYDSEYYRNNWMGTSESPSDECKDAITTMHFKVYSFGEADSEESVTLEKIVIKYNDLPSYKVIVEDEENLSGTVKVFREGREGDTVGFIVKGDECYVAESVTITDAEGNVIPANATNLDAPNLEGYFTFTQPASDVTVSIDFVGVYHEDGDVVDNLDGTHSVYCIYCNEVMRTVAHVFEDGYCECGAAEVTLAPVVVQMMNGSTVAAEFEYATLEEALADAYDLASTKFDGAFCDPVITVNEDVVLTADVEVPAYTTVNFGDNTITVGDYAFEITASGKVTANYAIDFLQSNPLVKEAVSGTVYTYSAMIQMELNSKSLTLADQIFINFSSSKKLSGYTGDVEYGFDYYWSEKPAEVMTVYAEDFTTNTSSKIVAATMGIPAKDMSNEIVGRFWAKVVIDGVEYYAYSNTVEYSIVQYAASKLGGSDAKLNSLLKAMLNYGTYFQIYKDYKLDDLANAILDEADKVLPTAEELKASEGWIAAAAIPNLEDYSPASNYVKGFGLELLDVINIKYNLNKAPAAGIEHVMCVWTKAEYDALTAGCTTDAEISAVLTTENCDKVLSKSEDGNFFLVEGIAAKKYADTIVTRSMYVDANGELQLDYVYSYSPITYCTKNINDAATGTNAKLSDTCKALMLYSAAARDYFNYTVDAG